MTESTLPTASPTELRGLVETIGRERQALADERGRFQREQADVRQYWRRRLKSEWHRLEAEAARLAAERQQLARQQAEATGDLEMQRRQVEAGWQALRTSERAWREETARREHELTRREAALGQQQAQLVSTEAGWQGTLETQEAIRRQREIELVGIEQRIVNLRTVLARLQAGRGRLDGELNHGSLVTLPRSAPPDDIHTGRLLDLLADLRDEEVRLARFHEAMLGLREAWQQEWDRADVVLIQREGQLELRDQELRERQQSLRDWMSQLQSQHEENQQRAHQLRSSEARLLSERSTLHCERGRLLALVRARAIAARARLRIALRLREQIVDLSLEYAARQQQLADRECAMQQAALERERQFERRQTWLDERERELAAKELALFQAEQQLLARDPEPAEAAAELEHRLHHFLRLARRPLRRLEQREAELAGLHDELEAFRHRLLTEEQLLCRQRTELEQQRVATANRRALLESTQVRMRQDLAGQRVENDRLRRHAAALRDQLERLTLALLEPPPSQPALALVAA